MSLLQVATRLLQVAMRLLLLLLLIARRLPILATRLLRCRLPLGLWIPLHMGPSSSMPVVKPAAVQNLARARMGATAATHIRQFARASL